MSRWESERPSSGSPGPYREILVPLDGSRFARSAVPTAVWLAKASGATLRLARVHTPLAPSPGEEPPEAFLRVADEIRESEQETLERDARRLAREGVVVETAFLDGPVARALAEQAEATADLVVMATHGRGRFTRLWLGSVADGLARCCSVPLLFLRPPETAEESRDEDAGVGGKDDEGGQGGAGEGPTGTWPGEATSLAHLLVPLDGSDLAEQGLARALELGRLVGERLTLVRVQPPAMLPGLGYPDVPVQVDVEAVRDLERQATEYLEGCAERVRRELPALQVETIVVTEPGTAEAILETADAVGADLVSMATHGRGGLQRLLLGSVADKVLRAGSRPVLLQRPGREPEG